MLGRGLFFRGRSRAVASARGAEYNTPYFPGIRAPGARRSEVGCLLRKTKKTVSEIVRQRKKLAQTAEVAEWIVSMNEVKMRSALRKEKSGYVIPLWIGTDKKVAVRMRKELSFRFRQIFGSLALVEYFELVCTEEEAAVSSSEIKQKFYVLSFRKI